MGENRKIIKGIYSTFQEIEEHFVKFENAVKLNDIRRINYYVKEIENKFFTTLDGKIKEIRKSHEIHSQYLVYKQQRNDIKKKSVPLN